jgi:hypothetical protein
MNEGVCPRREICIALEIATPIEERRRLSAFEMSEFEVVRHRVDTGFGNVTVFLQVEGAIEEIAAGYEVVIPRSTRSPAAVEQPESPSQNRTMHPQIRDSWVPSRTRGLASPSE